MNNQRGISSLVLLFILVWTIFIIWELNEYIGSYNSPKPSNLANSSGNRTDGPPVCETGEEGNCNDSNDVFLLVE